MKICNLGLRMAILCLLLNTSLSSNAQNNKLRMPADWEAHDALWIGFRTFYSIGQYDPVILEVIKIVHHHTPVKLLLESPLFFPEGPSFFADYEIDLDKIELVYHAPSEIWLRDPGPVFAKDSKGKLTTLDFQYTGRQNKTLNQLKPDVIKKGEIDLYLGKMVTSKTKKVDLVMEGGAMNTNGNGTFILVESVTLGRNPGLTKKEVEKRLSDVLQVDNIIWLREGLAEDPMHNERIVSDYYGSATGGHVDEFVRFVNDSTILMSWVPEKDTALHLINVMNYHRLADAYQRLQAATNGDGRHFKIVRIPHPDLFYEERVLGPENFIPGTKPFPGTKQGDTIKYVAAASYMNYLLTNDLLILPKYFEEGDNPRLKKKDEQVYNIFRHYFPDRKIVRINPLLLNFHGGGMHCIYQEQPSVDPVTPAFINKKPIVDK